MRILISISENTFDFPTNRPGFRALLLLEAAIYLEFLFHPFLGTTTRSLDAQPLARAFLKQIFPGFKAFSFTSFSSLAVCFPERERILSKRSFGT